MKEAYIRVSLSKDFGVHGFLTLEAQGAAPVPVEAGILEFDQLTDQLNRYFKHYMDNHQITQVVNNRPIERSNEVEVIGDEIRVTMDKGKRYYRVICGEWREHGVQFWPEHMKQNGIDPKQIPDEGYKFRAPCKVIVQTVDGKPKRVLKIVPN